MFLHLVRIYADWLADPTNGVTAMLSLVPRDAGDPLPPAVTVFDETRDLVVATGRLPAVRPCVTVHLYRSERITIPSIQGAVGRDYQPTLLIRYADTDSKTDDGVRDACYTQQAILMSLDRLHRQANDAARQRHQTQVMGVREDVTWLKHFTPIENGEIAAGFLVPLEARDLSV